MLKSGNGRQSGLWGYATDAAARRAFLAIVERWCGDDPAELRDNQDDPAYACRDQHTPTPPISPACPDQEQTPE